jgi:hypothetical protein
MGQRKINVLDAVSDDDAANNTWFTVKCDPGTGVSGKSSVLQEKNAYSTFKKRYSATGSEGTTLTFSELAGKEIMLIMRGPGPIYEVDLPAVPASQEFTFDGTDIGLGVATSAGEPFLIHYKTPS